MHQMTNIAFGWCPKMAALLFVSLKVDKMLHCVIVHSFLKVAQRES